MPLILTAEERVALLAAQRKRPGIRHWRRYQALVLRGEGLTVAQVAPALSCTETSIYNWTAAYRRAGVDGVEEGTRPGAARRLDVAGDTALHALLSEGDPQAHGYRATGWTVPLSQTELGRQGWRASLHTIRRSLHRLGAMETAQVCAGPT
jgi:transposase